MLKIAVLVSGAGSNLNAIMEAIDTGYLSNVKIEVVISSKQDAYAITRAKSANINTEILPRKNYKTIHEYDLALLECLQNYDVNLIVLAGFLAILGEKFIQQFKNKIINVHPSLIPSFCGDGLYGIIPHKKALEYGVKITGATVHIVENTVDSGPIILQKAVEVRHDDTPQTLQKRVMEEAEWLILPQAILLLAQQRIIIDGRQVRILP